MPKARTRIPFAPGPFSRARSRLSRRPPQSSRWSLTMARAWHLKSRPEGLPTADNFELKAIELPKLGKGDAARPQSLAVGRSLHARPDERREKLCPAVRARRADGGRRGRRSRRKQGRGLQPRATSSCTWPGGATRRWFQRKPRSTSLPDLGAEPQQFLGSPRGDRRDRLFRAARCRQGQGRRRGVRLRRRGRGRLGRRSRSPRPRA